MEVVGVTPASVPGLGVLALIRESAYDDRVGLVRVVAGFVRPIPVGFEDLDRGHPLVRSLRAQAQADSVPLPRLECDETRYPLLVRPSRWSVNQGPLPLQSGKIAYWTYQMYCTTGIQKW